MEQVWAQALERKDTEKLVTGILEQIVNDAVDIAQMKTVVHTPRVPVAPVQEPGMYSNKWTLPSVIGAWSPCYRLKL